MRLLQLPIILYGEWSFDPLQQIYKGRYTLYIYIYLHVEDIFYFLKAGIL